MYYDNEDYGKPLIKTIVCQHCQKLMPTDCEKCPHCGRENTIGPYYKRLATQDSLRLGDKFLLSRLKDQNRKHCPHINKSYCDGRYYCDDCGEDMGSQWDC